MSRFGAVLIAATIAFAAASPASAADLINTGIGSAAPSSHGIGSPTNQDRTYGQFTFTTDVYVTGIEFYGAIQRSGTINLGIFNDDVGGNQPGLNQYLGLQAISALPGSVGWYGLTGLQNVFFKAGTYWVGSGTDGTFSALQYGNSPTPLGNESVRDATDPGYVDADNLNLSWRISGTSAVPASAIPEASTWMVMIVGLGTAGLSLRRSRTPAL